jgi:hypothetical protein
MGRISGATLLAMGCTVILGCSGTSLLRHVTTTRVRAAAGEPATRYLDRLGAEQAKLAAAEKAIPRRARTAAQFSRAISLLAVAIRQLARDLGALRPPRSVRVAHARLLAIVRRYANQLAGAAVTATGVGGELPAANALISATSTASRQFSATVGEIERMLSR